MQLVWISGIDFLWRFKENRELLLHYGDFFLIYVDIMVLLNDFYDLNPIFAGLIFLFVVSREIAGTVTLIFTVVVCIVSKLWK